VSRRARACAGGGGGGAPPPDGEWRSGVVGLAVFLASFRQ
jgi:hypothetical protein